MDWLEKPYRFRHPYVIIKLSIILFLFVSSKDAKAIIWYVFRAKVSHKTICQWTKKFPLDIPKEEIAYEKEAPLFLFADEKYIWIKGVQAYWWSVRDHLGNVLATHITYSRDSDSAKELFHLARRKIDRRVTAFIHDGLPAYPKAVHWIFGRSCKSVVTGLQKKYIMVNKCLYILNNNMSESLNAQIDAYLTKVQYNFESLESANHFAEMFCSRRDLRQACT